MIRSVIGTFCDANGRRHAALRVITALGTSLVVSTALAQPAKEQVPAELRVSDGPGACHVKAYFKPKNESYIEKILVSPERTETRVVPAVTRTVETEVVVTPERRVRRVTPAVYGEVTETIVETPETTREIVEPAVYETRKKLIEIKPSQGEWVVRKTKNGRAIQPVRDQRGRAIKGCETAEKARQNKACEGYMPSQEVYEYNGSPPVYGTVEEQVLVTPERRRTETVPAVTRQVTRSVLKTPATTQWETVPAVTRKETKTIVDVPERTEVVTIPAVYREETRIRTVKGEGVWRRAVCPPDINPYLISQVQLSLATNGYNPREFNGVFTRSTQDALERFQRDNGLPAGPLTIETLKLLGVTMK